MMKKRVVVKPVSKANWENVIKLTVFPKQQHFVLPVSVSLSKAYVKPDDMRITPFAIYADDIIIGFFIVKCDPYSSQNYWIEGFMIDKDSQNKGFGTIAVKDTIEFVYKKYKNCRALKLKVEPGNKAAIRVCEKCGLKKTGIYSKGEEIYIINIPESSASGKIPA